MGFDMNNEFFFVYLHHIHASYAAATYSTIDGGWIDFRIFTGLDAFQVTMHIFNPLGALYFIK